MIVEKWSDTGERIEREPTAAELAQMEADAVAAAEALAASEAAELERVAARESAMAKLAALGLSESEVLAIVGGA